MKRPAGETPPAFLISSQFKFLVSAAKGFTTEDSEVHRGKSKSKSIQPLSLTQALLFKQKSLV
jgi:hypothetical protein